MRHKIKQTTILLIITTIIIFALLSISIYVSFEFNNFRYEANIINSAGKIRGNIQRITKMELNNNNADSGIKFVEEFFDSFQNKKTGFIITTREHIFYEELKIFSEKWKELYLLIKQYRNDKSISVKNQLFEKSETCWELSNNLVLITQKAYEDKLAFFNIIAIVNSIAILGMFIIILIIRNYVQLKLEHMANYDSLTNIYNRYAYNSYINAELYKAQRYGLQFSLVIFDIDSFKTINDNYGHKTGDIVLKEISEISLSIIRKSDYLFRVGGEEFCIILSCSPIESGIKVASKIRKAIEEHTFINGIKVTISCGVAELMNNEDADSIFKRADNCLYAAKKDGKNQVWSSKNGNCYRTE